MSSTFDKMALKHVHVSFVFWESTSKHSIFNCFDYKSFIRQSGKIFIIQKAAGPKGPKMFLVFHFSAIFHTKLDILSERMCN